MGITKLGRCLTGALAVLALTACGGGKAAPVSGDLPSIAPVTDGYQLAFLGDFAQTGAVGGVKTALAQYAQEHPDGPQVSVVFEDSQGDGVTAVPLAYAIVADPTILGLIGPSYSGESAATNPIFNRAGLPEISPSATNATLTRTGWVTFHRLVANDSAQGAAGATYIRDAGKKRAFLIDDSEAYGTGLVGYVRQGLGDLVVGADSATVGQTDFSGTVAKVKAADADAVYYGGYYTEAGLLVKQLRAAGWTGLFVSGDGSEDPQFVEAAGDAANGAVLTNAAGAPSAEFSQAYAAANDGEAAGPNSMQTYDATNIFLAGILAGNTTRDALQSFVSTYSGTGAGGPITFDANGDIAQSTIWAYHVVDGKIDDAHPTAIE